MGCTPLNTRFRRVGFAFETRASASADADRVCVVVLVVVVAVVAAARANLGVGARAAAGTLGDGRTCPRARAPWWTDTRARRARRFY